MAITTRSFASRGSSFHVITTTLGNLLGPVSTLLCAPILAYQLGVAGRGELAASTMPLVLLGAALTIGLPEALTFRLGRFPGDGRQSLKMATLVLSIAGAFGAVILLFLAPWLATDSPTVIELVRLSAIAAVPTVVLWALRGTAQGLQRWATLNVEKALTGTARLLGIGSLALFDSLTVHSAFVVTVCAPLVGYVAYVKMILGMSQTRRRRRRTLHDMISFGSKVWLGSIAGILITRLDQVLILPLSSAEQLGLYAAAVNVGDIPFFMTAAFGSIMLAKESSAASNARVEFASRVLFSIVLCVTSIVGATSHLWFGWLFGPSFAVGADTAVVLLGAALISAPGTIAGSALTGRGHAHDRSLALGVGLLVNVVLLLWLVPILGAFGAALATFGGTLAVTSLNLMQLWRRLGIRPDRMILLRRPDVERLIVELFRRRR
ncbi:polysaccharide biosynthesis C-terminal domain-containing protein [Arthrobacter sp. NPDC058097]|uniref:oligosaccharide flippase family protein n=1 Tax=Arthrobacter sp. NPDC058097 TaxID=3346340 RepID=UPI0036DA98CE